MKKIFLVIIMLIFIRESSIFSHAESFDILDKYIAQYVMALLAVRWASIAFSTLTSDGGNLTKILPESVIMWLLIFLLWLGARKKEKK